MATGEQGGAGEPELPAELAEGAEGPYWKGLAAGKLVMPRCRGCGIWHWPAVFRCSACGSWEQTWEATDASGEIYTWTRMAPHRQGAHRDGQPVASVVVTLDRAGARLMGILELPTEESPVAIGDRVTATIRWITTKHGQLPMLFWRQTSTRTGGD